MDGIEAEWIGSIREWAESEPLVLEVYFFGSRVKGSHLTSSDLDVAVKVAGDTDGEALANAMFESDRWSEALGALLPVKVDLQSMSPGDTVVTPAVRDHGLLVYAKTPG